mgnify:CR=1 FL=1
MGLFLIIWPFVALILYVVAGFIFAGLEHSVKRDIIKVVFGFLGIICVLGIIISIPIGIYLIAKSGGQAKFSMKEAIKFGWAVIKKKFWFFVGVLVIMAVLQLILGIFGWDPEKTYDNNQAVVLAVIISIVFGVLQTIVGLGAMKIALKLVDGQEVKISDLFSTFPLFFKYLAGAIIYALIVLAGFILLIVPGIIWQMKYSLYPYFILEGAGPIEALKKSGQATKGAKLDLLIFFLLLGLIVIAGFIAILVGLFFAIPTVMVAMAFVYRKLQLQINAL